MSNNTDPNQQLTREEVLGGLPKKRASDLLFFVERYTAQLVEEARNAMVWFQTEKAVAERNLNLYQAWASGGRLKVKIQELERYAPKWADLVPTNNHQVRAALAHLLGQKYAFSYQTIPQIRQVLGLDDPEVIQAYQRLYGKSIESLYVPQTTFIERWRWVSAGLGNWLESLPPFWTAFSLTLTETVGAGILALPIATAGVGPLPGVVLLIVFGIVNILTIACMAEAILRSGTIRYGSAFIGQVVEDYLGSTGSTILSMGSLVECFLSLWAFYVGFATTMESATRIPAVLWVTVLFFVGLYFLRGKSLDATVASALFIGAISLSLIFVLSAIAFTHIKPENLFFINVPFVGSKSFDPSILEMVFGVIGSAYFGHLSVSNCAKVVIKRNPSGKDLVLGCMSAQAVTMVIYSIWVLAINSAISSKALAGETGTALIPLANEAGVIVKVLGSIFVILGMGIGSIHCSLGLYNLTRERLPTRSQPLLTLAQRQGRVLIQKSGVQKNKFALSLVYMGLENDEPYFRLDIQANGQIFRQKIIISDSWEIDNLKNQIPVLAQNKDTFKIDILQASPESVYIQIDSSLNVTYEGDWQVPGLSLADTTLPKTQRTLINWLTRQQKASLQDIAAYLEKNATETQELLRGLIEEGYIREVNLGEEKSYQANISVRSQQEHSKNTWQFIEKTKASRAKTSSTRTGDGTSKPSWVQNLRKAITSDRSYALLSIAPMIAVFLLSQWLVLNKASSFSELFSFTGLIIVFLLAGIFPVLLLFCSRRKGEIIPGFFFNFLENKVILGVIYALSLSSLFLHGLVIWKNPFEKACALFVGVMMIAIPFMLWKQGVFKPRLVIELRQDMKKKEQADFAIIASGRPLEGDVQLVYADGREQNYQGSSGEVPNFSALRSASFQVNTDAKQELELKVWAHLITASDDSQALPVLMEVEQGSDKQEFDLKLSDGQIALPITSNECTVRFTLA